MKYFERIAFLLSEALSAIRRDLLMAFAAISTISVALFILGGLGYVYYRGTQYAKTIPGKFEMRVFLTDETTKAQVPAVAAKIREIPGVAEVSWIPRDKYWEERIKQQYPQIAEGIDNPLPEAFKVKVTDLKLSDAVVVALKGIPQVRPVDGVQYLKEEEQLVEQILKVVRWLGIVVGGLLMLTGGVLIFNAIKLTILNRRVEIRIMSLVGASRPTIAIPFLIEGVVEGMGGGLIATFLIAMANNVFLKFWESISPYSSSQTQFPTLAMLGVLTGAGAAYGLVCSLLAVRGPLKYS